MANSPNAEGQDSDRSKILGQDSQFFKVVMSPSNQGLRIPEKFVRKYLSMKKRYVFMLHVLGETIGWPATVSIYPHRISSGITKGWKKFVLDNRLRIGAVCVFELVAEATKFNAIIYRSAEDDEIAT